LNIERAPQTRLANKYSMKLFCGEVSGHSTLPGPAQCPPKSPAYDVIVNVPVQRPEMPEGIDVVIKGVTVWPLLEHQRQMGLIFPSVDEVPAERHQLTGGGRNIFTRQNEDLAFEHP